MTAAMRYFIVSLETFCRSPYSIVSTDVHIIHQFWIFMEEKLQVLFFSKNQMPSTTTLVGVRMSEHVQSVRTVKSVS